MKLIRFVTVVLALGAGWVLLSPDVRAQRPSNRADHKGAISQVANAMGVSKAVRDLPAEPPKVDSGEVESEPIRTIRNPRVRSENRAGQGDEWMDLAVQSIVPEPLMPPAIMTFEGNSSADNAAAFGGRVLPPDTHGDVGPNHFVQQTNLLVRIFNKAGAPLTPPFKLSSLFTSGGICNTTDNGDPYVAYDPLADRWLLSQFGFTSLSAPPYHQCIAISQTPDPTGAYFLYDFTTPGTEFPDYPKMAVWPDAYFMTVNQFLGGGPFDGAGAYAFDRKKMLAGDPTATFNYFNLNLASHPEGIGGLLASDLDGLVPPPAGAPGVFSYFLATEFGDALDGLRLFDFHPDFVSPGSATFTERAESPLAVAAFNPLVSGIPQPGGAPALATLRDRLMTRLQYRNTTSGQSLVVTHTVDADPSAASLAGIRYYQLLRAGATYAVAEQATFAPDTIQRWMGSAATDHDGNLAVGYSAASASVFPGIRFAGRLATDPPGGLFQGESTAISGSGVQTHTSGRWGDYSALNLDPGDDCTFWYTQEYYTSAGQASSPAGWQTRVATFRFPTCSTLQRGTINVHVTLCSTGADVAKAAVTINGALYGVTNGSGALTAAVAPGTFTVAASSPAGSGSTSVTVGAGGTVAANVCLAAAALPDLVETAVSNPPATVSAGGSFSVTDTAQNNGTVPAPASTTRYYLSLDTTKGAGDVLLTGTRSVPVLAAAGTSTGTVTVTVPGATASGTYFLLACADDTGAVPESNEANNCLASTATVDVLGGGGGAADLIETAVSNPPASVAVGETFAMTDTTKNQGGDPTLLDTKVKYFLSLDTVKNRGDRVLKGVRVVPPLAGGASSTGNKNVTVKLTTPPGTYFVLACADGANRVVEADETNNCRASTTQVIVH